MLLLSYCPRPISFLVAQKSMSGVVGFFANAFNAIPVARPQDTAKTVSLISASTDLFCRALGQSPSKRVQML
jgi:hypothetical protein